MLIHNWNLLMFYVSKYSYDIWCSNFHEINVSFYELTLPFTKSMPHGHNSHPASVSFFAMSFWEVLVVEHVVFSTLKQTKSKTTLYPFSSLNNSYVLLVEVPIGNTYINSILLNVLFNLVSWLLTCISWSAHVGRGLQCTHWSDHG